MRDGTKGTGEGREPEGLRRKGHTGRRSSGGRPSASSGHSRPLGPPGTHPRKQEAGEGKRVPSLHAPPRHACVYAHTHALRHVAASPFETRIRVWVG